MGLCGYVYVSIVAYEVRRGFGSIRAEITSHCEPSDVGAKNWSSVLWDHSICQLPLRRGPCSKPSKQQNLASLNTWF